MMGDKKKKCFLVEEVTFKVHSSSRINMVNINIFEYVLNVKFARYSLPYTVQNSNQKEKW